MTADCSGLNPTKSVLQVNLAEKTVNAESGMCERNNAFHSILLMLPSPSKIFTFTCREMSSSLHALFQVLFLCHREDRPLHLHMSRCQVRLCKSNMTSKIFTAHSLLPARQICQHSLNQHSSLLCFIRCQSAYLVVCKFQELV